jgi:hypothetical protein
MPRIVRATRYVTPLREGGSLPAIVEADDLGLYVLKFRGAGQGPLALVAELIAGEIGRSLGLNVPEIVLIQVDEALGRNEPDEEIRDLLQASVGLNLALDYLPGSVMFDPAAGDTASAEMASRIVWFDSFITNVDRTASNPNLLVWHKSIYLIDHGAALYFHHDWQSIDSKIAGKAEAPFPHIRKHLLLPWASSIKDADTSLRRLLNESVFVNVLESVPEEWLVSVPRTAYVEYFVQRLASASIFVEEAALAHADIV